MFHGFTTRVKFVEFVSDPEVPVTMIVKLVGPGEGEGLLLFELPPPPPQDVANIKASSKRKSKALLGIAILVTRRRRMSQDIWRTTMRKARANWNPR